MLKNFIILSLSLLLISCVSTSNETQDFVAANDWSAIGNIDGSEGTPEKSEMQLQAFSDKYKGEKVDYKQYQDSYLAAVTVYCEPNNARMLAVLGKPYYHACDRFPNGVFFYQDWINATRSTR